MKKVIIVLTLLSVFCSQVFAQRELLPKGKWFHYRQVVELGKMTQLQFVNDTTVISTLLKRLANTKKTRTSSNCNRSSGALFLGIARHFHESFQ